MDKKSEIERSIITRFRKEIWRPFIKAINEFNLVEDGDKIAVCISGGKDSFLLAKCFEELKKHGKKKFDLEFLTMNPGYDKESFDLIHENSDKLGIKPIIFDSNIFEEIKSNDNACYLCARKRRGALYAKAKELGCNKIALGHHFDDVVETILMSMIYNGEFKTMMPILNSTNFEGMKLIRPLYYVREKDVRSWCKYNDLNFIACGCIITRTRDSKRYVMKDLVKQLNELYKGADINIMNATKEVNLSTIISYINDKNE